MPIKSFCKFTCVSIFKSTTNQLTNLFLYSVKVFPAAALSLSSIILLHYLTALSYFLSLSTMWVLRRDVKM